MIKRRDDQREHTPFQDDKLLLAAVLLCRTVVQLIAMHVRLVGAHVFNAFLP